MNNITVTTNIEGEEVVLTNIESVCHVINAILDKRRELKYPKLIDIYVGNGTIPKVFVNNEYIIWPTEFYLQIKMSNGILDLKSLLNLLEIKEKQIIEPFYKDSKIYLSLRGWYITKCSSDDTLLVYNIASLVSESFTDKRYRIVEGFNQDNSLIIQDS